MNAVHGFVLQQFSEEMSTLLLPIVQWRRFGWGALLWLLPFITLASWVLIRDTLRMERCIPLQSMREKTISKSENLSLYTFLPG